MEVDYVIVGGGSAGSVLANRLSARSANRVLLIEAGMDTPHGKVPAEILDSYPGKAYFDPRFTWAELKVTLLPKQHNRPDAAPPPARWYEQARVMGGGSSINGQLANRGSPNDYDEWERLGAAGWRWEKVLPYFRKVERDIDFEGPLHGNQGRIPVRRLFPEDWPGHAHAIARALEEQGFTYLEDQNGEFRDGYFPLTISNLYDRRVSSAIGYLDPATRRRANLTIMAETRVREILFEGLRATGVVAESRDGGEIRVSAREVILCSGALHSPAHLLRAGIGPAGELKERGIAVRHHLAGVGKNLMEHPAIGLSGYLTEANRLPGHVRRHMSIGARYSSNIEGAPPGDMFFATFAKSAWHAVGERIGSMLLWVNKTYSTGEVTLRSADWREEPQVDFGLCSDRRDLDRLVDGYQRLMNIYLSPFLKGVIEDPFPSAYSDRVRAIGRPTKRNEIITAILARLLDGPAPLRKTLIDKVINAAAPVATLANDRDALESFVAESVHGIWHASCSCRMGADGDPMAVTDANGRVQGMAGLRVCDASIFPAVPCANTNFPTLMSAEKIADAILEGA